jgi:hypothetical protein
LRHPLAQQRLPHVAIFLSFFDRRKPLQDNELRMSPFFGMMLTASSLLYFGEWFRLKQLDRAYRLEEAA